MFGVRVRRSVILMMLGLSGMGIVLPRPMSAEKSPHAVNLSLRDMSGNRINLRSLRGRIVVLNFWATWCGPCRAEMPLLVQANDRYEKQGIVFVGASLDDSKTQKRISPFLRQYRVDYTILTGASADDLAKLKLGIAIPATAFIDEKGKIRFRILGQMRPGELQKRIDWLLRESAAKNYLHIGPAPPAQVIHLSNQ